MYSALEKYFYLLSVLLLFCLYYVLEMRTSEPELWRIRIDSKVRRRLHRNMFATNNYNRFLLFSSFYVFFFVLFLFNSCDNYTVNKFFPIRRIVGFTKDIFIFSMIKIQWAIECENANQIWHGASIQSIHHIGPNAIIWYCNHNNDTRMHCLCHKNVFTHHIEWLFQRHE